MGRDLPSQRGLTLRPLAMDPMTHRGVAQVDVCDLAERRLLCRRQMYRKCSPLLPDANSHDSGYSPSRSGFSSFRCHERSSDFFSSITATADCLAVGGPPIGRGAAPQLWTAHPRRPSQNIPIWANKGMTCPDLGEIGFGRGRGFSPVVFPTPLLLV